MCTWYANTKEMNDEDYNFSFTTQSTSQVNSTQGSLVPQMLLITVVNLLFTSNDENQWNMSS